MASFADLKPDTYYLLQVDAESDIELVSVLLQTKKTILLRSYLPQAEDFFKYMDEPVYKLIEELDAETAQVIETLYQPAEEPEYYEEAEE
jgi:hypothetical protein